MKSLMGGACWMTAWGPSAAFAKIEKSRVVRGVTVGAPSTCKDSHGDTWVTTWADDGKLYTPSNDSVGFHSRERFIARLPELTPAQKKKIARLPELTPAQKKKILTDDISVWDELPPEIKKKAWVGISGPLVFNVVDGADPLAISGTTINWMQGFSEQDEGNHTLNNYGNEIEVGKDGATWKSSGCTFVDGALYWVIARHKYGEMSGDSSMRQTAANASLIKSTDYGLTWARSPQQNFQEPMFPDSDFAAPYFIDYGRAKAPAQHGDEYVYAVSNNGFWDNGDRLILGRVPRLRIGALDARDWEFLTEKDGSRRNAWTSKVRDALPLIERPGQLGSSGVTYLPERGRYMLIGWYYPAGGGKVKDAHTTTVWNFFESPTPWGPWTQVGSHAWSPEGYYCPSVCGKFQSADRVYVITAGDWTNSAVYRLTVVPITLHS